MLTDASCKRFTCPPDKARARLSDSGGLYLEAAPNGSRRWFWKYYFASKEKRLALGAYPAVSLKDARIAGDDARRQQQQGVDPAAQRQLAKLRARGDDTKHFEAVAREFHKAQSPGWSAQYAARWIERMEKDLFPWIGALELDQVTAPTLLNEATVAGAKRRAGGASSARCWPRRCPTKRGWGWTSRCTRACAPSTRCCLAALASAWASSRRRAAARHRS